MILKLLYVHFVKLFDQPLTLSKKEKCFHGLKEEYQFEIALILCKYAEVPPDSFIKNEKLLNKILSEISKTRVKSAKK